MIFYILFIFIIKLLNLYIFSCPFEKFFLQIIYIKLNFIIIRKIILYIFYIFKIFFNFYLYLSIILYKKFILIYFFLNFLNKSSFCFNSKLLKICINLTDYIIKFWFLLFNLRLICHILINIINIKWFYYGYYFIFNLFKYFVIIFL